LRQCLELLDVITWFHFNFLCSYHSTHWEDPVLYNHWAGWTGKRRILQAEEDPGQEEDCSSESRTGGRETKRSGNWEGCRGAPTKHVRWRGWRPSLL